MFKQCRAEPSLDELFDDFAMQLLMRRDGVTESDVKALLCDLKDIRKLHWAALIASPLATQAQAMRQIEARRPWAAGRRTSFLYGSYDCWIIADMSIHSAHSLRHGI